MEALVWIGVAILAIAVLGWLVFKITLWLVGMIFLVGLLLMIWGAVKVKRTI